MITTTVTMNTLEIPEETVATHDFTYNGETISVDTTRIVLKHNTYTKNFYGKKSSLVSF